MPSAAVNYDSFPLITVLSYVDDRRKVPECFSTLDGMGGDAVEINGGERSISIVSVRHWH